MRSTKAPLCDSSLVKRIAIDATGTPVELLFAIAKAADPGLAALPPPGVVNGGPAPSEPTPQLTAQRITWTGKKVPIERALDLVTESVEGLGWWAEERCAGTECACRIGLVAPDTVNNPISMRQIWSIQPLVNAKSA